ncbi:MAG: hypothetical protein V2A73_05515, partial [Pseudomonadota bacterium]
WMNSIRSSGPYFTRVAVYPNDVSDKLNEERYGTIVDLEWEVTKDEDYLAFRKYCSAMIERYLASVSVDRQNPVAISRFFDLHEDDAADPLEQLLYAADGSSRRFLSLMDRCLNYIVAATGDGKPLAKNDVLSIIRGFAENSLAGYTYGDRQLAESIAKVCRKQVGYRFRLPMLSAAIRTLHASREELNVLRVLEVGTGKRSFMYEFTYPFCLAMEIPTHQMRETSRVCPSRDRVTGEWITKVSTIRRDHLDVFKTEERRQGEIVAVAGQMATIVETAEDGTTKEYYAEELEGKPEVGATVSFIAKDGIALDLIRVQ